MKLYAKGKPTIFEKKQWLPAPLPLSKNFFSNEWYKISENVNFLGVVSIYRSAERYGFVNDWGVSSGVTSKSGEYISEGVLFDESIN